MQCIGQTRQKQTYLQMNCSQWNHSDQIGETIQCIDALQQQQQHGKATM